MIQRVCPSCSIVSETDKSFCPECGTSYMRSSGGGGNSDGGGLATAGLVCGIVSFLLLPFIFGTLGIIFGGIAWNKGHPRGPTATIVSIIGLVVGMLVTIWIYNSMLW